MWAPWMFIIFLRLDTDLLETAETAECFIGGFVD
jgi:hypothetical protein